MKKLTRENVAKLLIEIQDSGDLKANIIATRAINQFGLEKQHQKFTGNKTSRY